MSGGPSASPLVARVRRPAGPAKAWILSLVLLAAALPRLWRLEAVGEGTDEAYSVTATRAILDGRFSYRDFDDFAVDAYQAKFCPVAEAAAAPFVALLGDRPLAFRLPSLLASLALGALLVRFAARRFGAAAGWGTAACWVFDYRGVVYAQTHRYVALEQLLAFVLFLAVDRADRRRGAGPALVVLGVGLLLFHTHLLAVLTVGALGLASLVDAWKARGGPRRPPSSLAAFAYLLVHAALVLALFRVVGLQRFFASEGGLEAVRRAAVSTVRAIAGQGVAAAPLGIVGALALLRRGGRTNRALAIAALVPLAAFAVGSLRLGLAPRYVLTAQPFLFVAAGAVFARVVEAARARWAPDPVRGRRLAVALGAALAAVGAAPTLAYLRSGGGRDVEAPIVEALRARAAAGDPVLYDDALFDPFRRRPAELPSVTRAVATDPEGERVVDRLGVRWIVRSSADDDRPLYTPAFRARLEPVATSRADLLLQAPLVLTLYRVRPR